MLQILSAYPLEETKSLDFFHSIAHPSYSLHSLLPASRDPDLLARLRAPTKFPRIPTRTKNISRELWNEKKLRESSFIPVDKLAISATSKEL